MSFRKSIVSYIIWLCYTLPVSAALLCLAGGITGGKQEGIFATAIFLPVVGVLVFLVHRFLSFPEKSADEKNMVRVVAEAAAVVVLLAIGLFLRVKEMGGAQQDTAYFEMAAVSAGQEILQYTHGAVYFYVQLLHALFYFLGNKLQAAVWLQLVLWLGCGALLFSGIRRLCGAAAAFTALAFFCVSPGMIQRTLLLSPELFFLFFFLVGLLWMAAAYGRGCRPAELFGIGCLAAVLGYLDIAGMLLLFFAGMAVFAQPKERQAAGGRKWIALPVSLAGFFAGFLVCVLADAFLSGKLPLGVLRAWFALYRPEGLLLALQPFEPAVYVECGVLTGLMAIGIFSFWCDRKRDFFSAAIIGAALTAACAAFGIFTAEMPGTLYVLLQFTVLAGISVEQTLRRAAENTQLTQALPARWDKTAENTAKQKLLAEQEPFAEQELTPEQEPTEVQELPPGGKKINYIENPLPLPKKHVKRVMDYRIKEEDALEDFDIMPTDDDDFDL